MKFLLLLCSLSVAWSCFYFPPPRPPPTTATTTTTTTAPVGNCKCGVSKSSDSKIVGGENATPNEYPWQVRLKSSQGFLCGGILLSCNTVLTAAHCKASGYTAYLGDHDRSIVDSGEVSIPVQSFINHPDYNSDTYDNDFAIVTLQSCVTFSDKIYPICLPEGSSSSYENIAAQVSGWGTTSSGGPTSNILQKVTVKTMTNAACTTGTQYNSADITDKMICAANPGKDSCQGDSGGPLFAKKSGADYFEVIGVVSWGYGCALSDAPGVYARVTSRLDWIKSKVTGTTCPKP